MNKDSQLPFKGSSYFKGLLWNIIWLFLNISLTLLNKSIFVHLDFPFPITISMIHMIFTCFFSKLFIYICKYPVKTLTPDQHKKIAAFSLLFCANIMIGNIGIHFTSVAISQVIRASIPGVTMFLSFFILGKQYTLKHLATIITVIIGVILATYGDLEFSLIGLVLQIFGCILSSCKSVTASSFLVGDLKFHPIELAFRMSFYAMIQMFIFAYILGEISLIIDNLPSYEYSVLFILATNGFMAFLLNFSNFMFTSLTSALTVTVSGSLKNILTIVISIIIFHTPITFINGSGIIITIIGASLYNVVNYQYKQK